MTVLVRMVKKIGMGVIDNRNLIGNVTAKRGKILNRGLTLKNILVAFLLLA